MSKRVESMITYKKFLSMDLSSKNTSPGAFQSEFCLWLARVFAVLTVYGLRVTTRVTVSQKSRAYQRQGASMHSLAQYTVPLTFTLGTISLVSTGGREVSLAGLPW